MATQAQLAAVQQLYIGYLGRAADQAGQNFWADAIASGTATIESVALGFTLSQEYQSIYGDLSGDALVAKVYENVLGRAADAEGQAFWAGQLESGVVTADTLVATMINSLGAQDQATINNKVFVAQTYTDTVGAKYNAQAGADVLVGVNDSAASVTAALEKITDGTLTGSVPGLGLINTLKAAQEAQAAYDKETDSTYAKAEKAKTDAETEAKKADAKVLAATVELDKAEQNAKAEAFYNAAADKAIAQAQVAAYNVAAANKAAADAAVTANQKVYDANAAAFNSFTTADQLQALSTVAGQSPAFADAAEIVAFLADDKASDVKQGQQAKLSKELSKLEYGAEIAKQGSLELAQNEAAEALTTAKAPLSGTEGAAYTTAADKTATDEKALEAAIKADKDFAEAQATFDKYAALKKAVEDANSAITKFNNEQKTVELTNVDKHQSVSGADKVQDVFFFAPESSAAKDNTNPFTISKFGTGDSIVIGNSFVNGGSSLKAGDNNKLEFFLVQGKTGLQLVLEQSAYSSNDSDVKVADNGNVTGAGELTVITLTGVTADQVTFDNGVLSFV